MVVFDTVSELQKHLKNTIAKSEIELIVKKVLRDYIQDNVYNSYMPSGMYAYDRTYELLSAIDIVEVKTGTKSHSFEVIVNPNLLTSNGSLSDEGKWNQHASMPQGGLVYDTTEYIPMWIEYGTEGSLWDRDGAHFARDAYIDLNGGTLVRALEKALKNAGYKIVLS